MAGRPGTGSRETSPDQTALGPPGRSQSLHTTAMARDRREAVAGVGEGRLAKPARGKGGRKLDAGRTEWGKDSHVSARKG